MLSVIITHIHTGKKMEIC